MLYLCHTRPVILTTTWALDHQDYVSNCPGGVWLVVVAVCVVLVLEILVTSNIPVTGTTQLEQNKHFTSKESWK